MEASLKKLDECTKSRDRMGILSALTELRAVLEVEKWNDMRFNVQITDSQSAHNLSQWLSTYIITPNTAEIRMAAFQCLDTFWYSNQHSISLGYYVFLRNVMAHDLDANIRHYALKTLMYLL